MTEEISNQRKEMQRFGLDFGREILEKMRRISQLDIQDQLNKDCNLLEDQIRGAELSLKSDGEFSPRTVDRMRSLVFMNSIMSERYSKFEGYFGN
jgi:hypothetical protein